VSGEDEARKHTADFQKRDSAGTRNRWPQDGGFGEPSGELRLKGEEPPGSAGGADSGVAALGGIEFKHRFHAIMNK